MIRNNGRHNFRSPFSKGPIPSLSLDFAGTLSLSGLITFTRSTNAYYFNGSSNYLVSASANIPRFNFNPITNESLGLLMECDSVNLNYPSIPPTSGFTFSVNVVSALANQTTAPDGNVTATQYNMNAYGIYQYSLTTLTSATTYTVSMYVKGTTNYVKFGVCDSSSSNGFYGSFDLINVTASGGLYGSGGTYTSSTITALPNGWYRCTVTGVTGTMANSRFVYATSSTTVAVSYYAWGGQVEALGFATSLMTTTTAQVARTSDNAIINGSNFTSFYNQTQGTIYCEANSFALNGSTGNPMTFVGISDGTINNEIRLSSNLTSGGIYESSNGGVSQFGLGSATTPSSFTKMAGSYIANNAQFSQNNGSVVTDSSCTIPTVSQMQIGNLITGRNLSGNIKKIIYYPQALTAAQLQSLGT
jgi:hypothetical protein